MKQMKWITLVVFALLLPAVAAAQDQPKPQPPNHLFRA